MSRSLRSWRKSFKKIGEKHEHEKEMYYNSEVVDNAVIGFDDERGEYYRSRATSGCVIHRYEDGSIVEMPSKRIP